MLVFYVSGRLWESHLYVRGQQGKSLLSRGQALGSTRKFLVQALTRNFLVKGRILRVREAPGGPGSNGPMSPGGSAKEGPHACVGRLDLS